MGYDFVGLGVNGTQQPFSSILRSEVILRIYSVMTPDWFVLVGKTLENLTHCHSRMICSI